MVDVVFVNDGVTVVNGVRTEDRNLIVESITVGGGTPLLSTAAGVTVDKGDGSAAFDGVDTVPGQAGLWWNAAQRYTVPAANIGTGSTLVVRAKATLAGGIGANMVVRAGGTVIGSATVSNTAAYADYSFAIPGAGGGTAGAVSSGWSYDANNLPVAIVQKAGGLETGRWTLGYNGSGDVVSLADVTGGSSANLSYDAAGRITQVVANNGATVGWTWTPRSQLSAMSAPQVNATFSYDSRGLMTETRLSTGEWVRINYDANGNATQVSDSTGDLRPVALSGIKSAPSIAVAKQESLWNSWLLRIQKRAERVSSKLLPAAVAQGVLPSPPPALNSGLAQGLSAAGLVPGASRQGGAWDFQRDMPIRSGCCGSFSSTASQRQSLSPINSLLLMQEIASTLRAALVEEYETNIARSKLRSKLA